MKWKTKANIDNSKWKYVPSYATEIKKTIKRVSKEMEKIETIKRIKVKYVRKQLH